MCRTVHSVHGCIYSFIMYYVHGVAYDHDVFQFVYYVIVIAINFRAYTIQNNAVLYDLPHTH